MQTMRRQGGISFQGKGQASCHSGGIYRCPVLRMRPHVNKPSAFNKGIGKALSRGLPRLCALRAKYCKIQICSMAVQAVFFRRKELGAKSFGNPSENCVFSPQAHAEGNQGNQESKDTRCGVRKWSVPA